MPDLFSLMPGADEIEQWARHNKNAEHEMAELVQRLVIRTARPTKCDIPLGKATNQPGADGLVSSPGNVFCPAGDSVWEWGVPEPDRKANDDYRERTKATDEPTRLSSTFVFVTPWKWARSRTWEATQRKKGKWKDIKVLDSSDLAGWLKADFTSHLWLHERLNGALAGEVRSLASRWSQWAQQFYPPVEAPPELVLAGRADQADKVRSWVGVPGFYTMLAASQDEGAAFVAAALMTSEPHASALGQAAVVESEATWIKLVSIERQPMILIPLFDDVQMLKSALSNGHTVIQIFPLGTSGRFEAELPAPKEKDIVPVLLSMGVQAAKAGKIAKDSRGSMTALRQTLSVRTGSYRWSGAGETARFIAAASFANRWDEALEGDRAIMVQLAGIDYAALQAGLATLSASDDPTVRPVGSIWTATSQLDGLRSVARDLPAARWDALGAAAVEVLGAPDPAWELPDGERWMANIKGKGRPHSDGLRGGLAEALAALATQPDFAELSGNRAGPQIAELVVLRLLRAANDDPTGRRWGDLEDQLPLLAEAAPNVFLAEVQKGLEGERPVLAQLMIEEPGMLMPRSRATGLLWALERLAWSPDYLSAVVVVLARLAALDPGGRMGNRPASSLAEILMPWHLQTTADRHERFAAIEAARAVAPGPVWSLLVRLLPKFHGIGGMTSRPEWRNWAPAEDSNRYPPDYWQAIGDILGLLLADAGQDATRWKELVESYDDLPAELGDRVLAGLGSLDPASLDPKSLALLSDELNETVSNHRAFPDAKWVMPEERIAKLEAVAVRFIPTDPVIESAWLFEQHPSTQRVSGQDYKAYEERLAEMRRIAVAAIYAMRGWAGIEALVAEAHDAYAVGAPILALDDAANEAVLSWASSDQPTRVVTLAGYLWARTQRDGWPWSEGFIRGIAPEASPDRLAVLLLAASRGSEGWRLAEELGIEVERAYWLIFDAYPHGGDLWVAVKKLMEFGRPWGAIQIMGTALTLKRGPFEPDIAFEALFAAVRQEEPLPRDLAGGVEHELSEIIKALDAHGFDPIKLANMEFSLLPALEHQPEALKHIHRRLAEDADYFVAIVEAVFRAHGEEPPAEPDPDLQRVAQNAFKLLYGWHGPMPGQAQDGSVSEGALNAWVDSARVKLGASGRAEIGDQRIGHALWYAPAGADGLHPHEAVRNLFERVANQDIETGYEIEGFNSRGVVWRGSGGEQERELAGRFGELAKTFRAKWPRTAGVYRGMQDSYEDMAKRQDEREALD
jgi:hypothetical protein